MIMMVVHIIISYTVAIIMSIAAKIQHKIFCLGIVSI